MTRCVHYPTLFMTTFNYITRVKSRKISRKIYVMQITAMLFMQSVSAGPKGVQVICLNEPYLVRELLREGSVH